MGNEWLVMCPFHDNRTTPSCCINVSKGLFICYSCGEKGDIHKLSAKLGSPAREVYDLKGTRKAVRSLRRSLTAEHDDTVKSHPERWLDQYDGEERYEKWGTRGITADTVDHVRLGYAPFTTEKYGRLDSLTIPIRDVNNNVMGIIRRVFGDMPDGQRYFYPRGFKISWHLFNVYDASLNEDSPLVITEGSIDCLLMQQAGFASVALLGANLHPHQRTILRTMPHDDIVLMLDYDKPGRQAAWKIAPMLLEDGFNVKMAALPKRNRAQEKNGRKIKDAGDMSQRQRVQAIEKAKSYIQLRLGRASA